jgi:hypothetical protein
VLLRREVLDGIVRGDIDLVFRRWTKPTVRTGGSLLTPAGLLHIDRGYRISPRGQHYLDSLNGNPS